MDTGYDNNRVMDETRERGVVPIVCLRKGRPIPMTAIPDGSDEWKRLYRGRAAVEREFGRLKNEYGARACPRHRSCPASRQPCDGGASWAGPAPEQLRSPLAQSKGETRARRLSGSEYPKAPGFIVP
jgi:hypothetical protein